LLVPEQAVTVERGKAFVFLVDDKNVLERRLVELGPRHDGLRVVKDALKATGWIVLGKVEGLRAGMTVKPEKAIVPQPRSKPEETGRSPGE
jgi:multidrug efflux system membrane fusion protein